MRTTFLLIAISFYSIIGFAQVDIQTGKAFIVNTTNDTTYGKIFRYPPDILSKRIKFIPDNSDQIVEYIPSNLSGFHIEPDIDYVSLNIKQLNRRDTIETSYFALIAVRGEIEFIVVYTRSGKNRYFLKSEEFGMSELLQVINIENGLRTTYNQYKKTLGKYFYRFPNFIEKINKTKFTAKAFTELIQEYNLNFEKSAYVVHKNKNINHFVAHVGWDNYKGENKENHVDATGFVIGFKNSIYDEFKSLNIELVLGVNFRHYAYNAYYYSTAFPFKEKTNMVELPLYIEYNNKINLLSPIIQAGIKPFAIRKIHEPNYDSQSSKWGINYDIILGVGLGLNYKRVTIKYLIYAQPKKLNSFGVDVRIN